MSDQGFYQKGINSAASGVVGALTEAGVVSGAGTTSLDSSGGAFIATLPAASIGAGAVVTLFGTDAALAGGAVTVAAGAGDTIDGIALITTAVNSAQSYISDGVSVWVAFPYAV
jgi:hypothetical protein